jgi:hypothetical protein
MRHFLLLIVCIVFIAASACSVVTVTEPIGEEPVLLQPKDWEGLWKIYLYSFFDEEEKEGYALIEVSDSEKGVIKIQGIGREPESVHVYLRESNGWMFGSYRDPELTDDKGFCWGRFKKDGDHIYFWVPDYDRFTNLVNDGLLPGHPYDGEQRDYSKYLILSGLKPEHMDLITSDSKGVLFYWDQPFFMVRISNDID